MKKIMVLPVLALVLAVPCFALDPAEGFWISVDEKTGKTTAGWEIFVQNGKLFGRICSVANYPQDVKAFKCNDSYKDFPTPGKVSEMTVVGTTWIFGLTMRETGKWRGGSVIDPESGKMYKSEVSFHPADGKRYKTDTLEMRGEIGLGIGRSQYWRKSTREEASGVR
jgi:uncharacterized protein (DUF2147 family)